MKRSPLRSRGFSFTELMFAVIVLGIGFILVAAVFPVAISQTQTSVDDTVGSAFARSAASLLGNVTSNPNYVVLPVTDGRLNSGVFVLGSDRVWPRLTPLYAGTPGLPSLTVPGNSTQRFGYMVPMQGPVHPTLNNSPPAFGESTILLANNVLSTADSRYAWTALYRRDLLLTNSSVNAITYIGGVLPTGLTATISPYAQVTVIGLRIRNTGSFSTLQMTANNLRPTAVGIKVTEGQRVDQPDLVWFAANNGNIAAAPPNAAVAGAYLVVGDDRLGGTNAGRLNGKVLQLGAQRLDLDSTGVCFELATGSDLNLIIRTSGNEADDINEQLPALGTPIDINVWKTFPAGDSAYGFLVGAGLENPDVAAGAGNVVIGAARDIAVYTTFVPVTP